jgi:hypothetical protein
MMGTEKLWMIPVEEEEGVYNRPASPTLSDRTPSDVTQSRRMAKAVAIVANHSLEGKDVVIDEAEDDITVTVAVGADVNLLTVTARLFRERGLP